jgi:hypothetical protein
MKKLFSEEQIIGILKEQEAGFAVKDITSAVTAFGGCSPCSRAPVYRTPRLRACRDQPPGFALCFQKRG